MPKKDTSSTSKRKNKPSYQLVNPVIIVSENEEGFSFILTRVEMEWQGYALLVANLIKHIAEGQTDIGTIRDFIFQELNSTTKVTQIENPPDDWVKPLKP